MATRSGLDDSELAEVLNANACALQSLAGASVLLTGATGWFGVWLLDALCAADDRLKLGLTITAVSRAPLRFHRNFPAFATDARIKWVESDVRRLAIRNGYTHVIHAATDTAVGSDPASRRALFDSIVDGTRNVLDASSSRCTSFLLISSGAIYGSARPNQPRFIEAEPGGPDPSLPGNTYGEAKRAAELIGAVAAAGGVPVRIARCFAFVGPHMPFDKHFAIGNFISDAVGGRKIRIKSDGRSLRSYLYMSDLVGALLTVLCRGVVGRAYNVGSEDGLSIAALAETVNRVLDGRGVIVDGVPSDPLDRYVPDTTRLRDELVFAPSVGLDQAILRTATWYRAGLRT